MARTESVVVVDSLEPVESRIQDGQATLDDGAVSEHVNVAGVNDVALVLALTEGTALRTGTIAGNTFTVFILK